MLLKECFEVSVFGFGNGFEPNQFHWKLHSAPFVKVPQISTKLPHELLNIMQRDFLDQINEQEVKESIKVRLAEKHFWVEKFDKSCEVLVLRLLEVKQEVFEGILLH